MNNSRRSDKRKTVRKNQRKNVRKQQRKNVRRVQKKSTRRSVKQSHGRRTLSVESASNGYSQNQMDRIAENSKEVMDALRIKFRGKPGSLVDNLAIALGTDDYARQVAVAISNALEGKSVQFPVINDPVISDRIQWNLMTLVPPRFSSQVIAIQNPTSYTQFADEEILQTRSIVNAAEDSIRQFSTTDAVQNQINGIHQSINVVLPQFKQKVQERHQCCASQSPCCKQGLYNDAGDSYKTILRRLAYRTRRLLRRIEYRGAERRQHARTRAVLHRVHSRLMRMVHSL